MKEGDKFGRLTIKELFRRPKKSNPRHLEKVALCVCECGNEIIALQYRLKSGNTKSCGCLQREATGNMSRKHGLTNSLEYNSWRGMLERCTNKKHKNYNDYGGRGIKVCDAWLSSFEKFYSDMGPKPSPNHSIERVDNNGGYEASNCIWASRSDQLENRRRYSSNRSGVTGVGWNKSLKKWRARINRNGKTIELGFFESFDDAVSARKNAEQKS